MADRAGFDMIELHAAHGYLISSFISPLSNVRTDVTAAAWKTGCGIPLEVFRAMRSAWPEAKPMSVRISANDWVGDTGVTPEDAVEIATMFCTRGGRYHRRQRRANLDRGRSGIWPHVPDPFSDRIRNVAGIATMAVGNIYEADHANSILMAGRADLVCLARPHLADPYWTLHEAARIGDRHENWPLPYLAGRDQAGGWPIAKPRYCRHERQRPAYRHLGGGSGVGAGIAARFADAGGKVTILGRRHGAT